MLARRALELGAGLPPIDRAGIRDTLAWALFANGRFDEAVAEQETALEEVPAQVKRQVKRNLEHLRRNIEEEIAPERESAIEQHVAELEAEISGRPEWPFAAPEDKWWY